MKLKLGMVMDPIESISAYKDSSLAMLLAASARGWSLHYMELNDLYIRDGMTRARTQDLQVRDDNNDWFSLGESQDIALHELDVLIMRKDPPFNMEFVYATYLLQRAEERGLMVINRPASLRDCNEKMFTAWFPELCPTTLVCREHRLLREFLAEHGDIVVKPLDGMGGASIFRVKSDDSNVGVIFETLTNHETRFAMAQKYIPEIIHGDKRILLIDGEPIPYGLARVPAKGELRGNLAAGAKGVGAPLTEREYEICRQVGPALRERGLLFVGLDVIGDYLTEINVTSPTCIRELDGLYNLDVAGQLMDAIANKIKP